MMTQNWAVRMTQAHNLVLYGDQTEYTPEEAEGLGQAILHWAKRAKTERAKETGESMKAEKIVVAVEGYVDGGGSTHMHWAAYRPGSEALKKFMADEFNDDWDICTVEIQE